MLTQSDLERERYEARRKAELDHNTLIKWAQLQRGEGRAEGEKIGIIHAYGRVLNRQETPSEKLAALSLEELTRLAEELQKQIVNQQPTVD